MFPYNLVLLPFYNMQNLCYCYVTSFFTPIKNYTLFHNEKKNTYENAAFFTENLRISWLYVSNIFLQYGGVSL